MATTERDVLEAKVLPELQAIASSMGVQGYFRLRKADLIGAIIAKARGEEFTPSASSTARSRRPAAESTTTPESAGTAAPASGGDAPAPGSPAAAAPAPAAPAPEAPAPAPSAPAAEGTATTMQPPSNQDRSIQDTSSINSTSSHDIPTSTSTTHDTAAQGGGQQGAQAPVAEQPAAAPAPAAQPAAAQQPTEQAPAQPSAPAAQQPQGEQPAAQDAAAPSGQAATQDAPAAETGSGQEPPEAGGDPADTGSGSTRRRRRRSRGGDDGGADQLQGILSAVTSGVAPVNPAGENGEAPAAAAAAAATDTQAPASGTQAPASGDTQADGQRDQGQRRDWAQGGRWDSGPASGGNSGGRSRRSRNRNRNRNSNSNRFPGGDVAVADRPDFRDRSGAPDDRPEVSRSGILDIRSQDGYGFLRVNGYLPGPDDVYVPLSMIRRLGLRRGDEVEAMVKLPRDNSDKYAACSRVDKVNGMDPEEARNRTDFKALTPLYPNERLRLEHNPTEISTRIMDLMSPIGKGQRGLIVSPPKAGKTTIMKQIANAVSANNPEVYLIILLTGERPEEVTDMQRSTKAEVIFSTFDRPTEDHCQIAELTVERAKRLVEYGRDVMILLDGITRLSRAYNLATPASGKILSGGVDSSALYPPKRFFGAARNLEEGGSLTILATALVDTGSRMDEVIFEEFKGTGNMEVRLDRKLSERRIFPALDIDASSTRKEDLLLESEELVVAWKLRRVLGALDPAQALELVVDRMRQSKTNAQFLRDIQRANIGGS